MRYPGQGVSLDAGPVLPLVLLGFVVAIVVVVMARYFRGLARRERELTAFAAQRGLSYVRGSAPTAGADVTSGPFATPWDEAFFTRLGPRLAEDGRGLTALHLMQGTWQGKQWEVFDRSALVRPYAPAVSWDRIAVTLVVLEGNAPLPGFEIAPAAPDPMEILVHADDGDFEHAFAIQAIDTARVNRALTDPVRQELLAMLRGPLGHAWSLFTTGSRWVLWFDGMASVAQIAAAMDVLAHLDDNLRG